MSTTKQRVRGASALNGPPARRRIIPAQPVPDQVLTSTVEVEPAPRKQFFFVDSSTTSTGKRRHVMKHHVEEKNRKRSGLLRQNMKKQKQDSRALSWLKEQRVSEGLPSSSCTSQSPVLWAEDQDKQVVIGSDDRDQSPDRVSCSLCSQVIRGSRTDPFDTLPMMLTDESQQLVIFWTSKLTYWSGQNTHMKISAFQHAMLHPMTFYITILTYCARYRAHLGGYKETPQSAHYIYTAENTLWRFIETAKEPSDDKIVMAFTALALQEDRYGNREKAQNHMEEATSRLKSRKHDTPFLDTFLHYVRYTMFPYGTLSDPQDACHLMNFLSEVQGVTKDKLYLAQVPTAVFEFNSPLYYLLSAGPHPSHIPNEERVWVPKYGSLCDICRVASLIHITAAMLDFRHSPARCRRFIDGVIEKVTQHHLDRWPSTESLLWLLLEVPIDIDLKNPKRAWSVGDIMIIVGKLPPQLKYHFSELLLRYLMLRPTDLEISLEKFEKELWSLVSSGESVVTLLE